jgi:hypothetical protein
MAHLKYYEDERQRWPVLHAAGRLSEAEVLLGIRRLFQKFSLRLRKVDIRFSHGYRTSNAGRYSITINMDYANWLTVAHEVAHTYHATKYKRDERWHGRTHARITDRFCAWITEQGWHTGALAHEVALGELASAQRAGQAALVAATPPPLTARIEHREEQVTRLTRKIKALTTRRARALRSLGALRRQLEKTGGTV